MGDAKGGKMSLGFLQSLAKEDYFLFGKGYGLYGVLFALTLGFLLPLLLSLMFMGKKKDKQRGVKVEVGGELGFTVRSSRFPALVEVPWEGATTVAALFEQSCRKHAQRRFLGSRKLISKETMTSRDGRPLEKLHLGEYEWQSYQEAFDRACNFASGLVKLGHNIESPAAIFAETKPEWFIAFQGCFRQNITVVTIYSTLGEDALIHSLNEAHRLLQWRPTLTPHSIELKQITILVWQSSGKMDSLTDPISLENIDLTDEWVVEAEDDDVPLLDVSEIDDWMDVVDAIIDTQASTLICDSKQLKKLLGISSGLETVRHIFYFGEDDVTALKSDLSEKMSQWTVLSFSEVERLGKESPAYPRLPNSSDTAVIMYTSGSTGLPKGVMMTHGNIVATAAAVVTVVPRIGTNDVYLAYLPLAHVFELAAEATMLTAGCAIGYGSALTLTDSSNKIKKGTLGDASMLKPTLMAAVPAILDRVRDGVLKKVEETGGISKKLFDIAYKRRLAAIEGSWLGAWGLEKLLWDVIVFRRIRSILGGRIRGMLCGGAPLSGNTQRFINVCLGAPIGQGYGLTETCAGAAFSEWDDLAVGRVGPPLPCCYIKLVSWEEGGYRTSDTPMPRGEVVIGGFSVTPGYFRNEAKTNEVYKVDERGMRWFYSGDIGQFHSDGCLEIIDRRKDIVKLQHGEYISLGKVEAALISSNYVDNIMVYADPFHGHCVALIVLVRQATESWARNTGIKYDDFADLCQKEETVHEVQESLLKAAKVAKLDKFEIPAKIKLLPDPWTPESGLVTASLKVKRENLKSKFKDDLQKLYE